MGHEKGKGAKECLSNCRKNLRFPKSPFQQKNYSKSCIFYYICISFIWHWYDFLPNEINCDIWLSLWSDEFFQFYYLSVDRAHWWNKGVGLNYCSCIIEGDGRAVCEVVGQVSTSWSVSHQISTYWNVWISLIHSLTLRYIFCCRKEIW